MRLSERLHRVTETRYGNEVVTVSLDADTAVKVQLTALALRKADRPFNEQLAAAIDFAYKCAGAPPNTERPIE